MEIYLNTKAQRHEETVNAWFSYLRVFVFAKKAVCRCTKPYRAKYKNNMNNDIQRIISGKSQVRYGANIHAAVNYLIGSAKSGALDQTDKHFKKEETERLKK
ncbi:MAG: hypothetical protein LBB73_06040 [Dysgonamonadaceae bacterium]|jgi:hypothetical protein|nr:hypothetical protein [Dysgonamonadaceae bacterium]